jgi:hypothetical protein
VREPVPAAHQHTHGVPQRAGAHVTVGPLPVPGAACWFTISTRYPVSAEIVSRNWWIFSRNTCAGPHAECRSETHTRARFLSRAHVFETQLALGGLLDALGQPGVRAAQLVDGGRVLHGRWSALHPHRGTPRTALAAVSSASLVFRRVFSSRSATCKKTRVVGASSHARTEKAHGFLFLLGGQRRPSQVKHTSTLWIKSALIDSFLCGSRDQATATKKSRHHSHLKFRAFLSKRYTFALCCLLCTLGSRSRSIRTTSSRDRTVDFLPSAT